MASTIYLYGALGRKYGKRHYINVASPAEAIRALSANFEGFVAHLLRTGEQGVGYKIICGKEALRKEELCNPSSGAIKIIPVIGGAKRGGTAQILMAIAIVGLAFALGPAGLMLGKTTLMTQAAMYGMGASMALGGVVQMLSAQPKTTGTKDNAANTPSTTFSGAVNTTAQGHPVPLGYGRLIVGSAVISAGILVDQEVIAPVVPEGQPDGPAPTLIWLNLQQYYYVDGGVRNPGTSQGYYVLPDGTRLSSNDTKIKYSAELARMEYEGGTVFALWGGGAGGSWHMRSGRVLGEAVTLLQGRAVPDPLAAVLPEAALPPTLIHTRFETSPHNTDSGGGG